MVDSVDVNVSWLDLMDEEKKENIDPKLEVHKEKEHKAMDPETAKPKEEPVKVEGPPRKPEPNAEDEAALKELLTIDETYATLLDLLEQFSPGEDGIQFNRKLRNFESTVTTMCPDEALLTQAFATFRAAALQSAVTARKLAAVGASFTRQQRQQLLRGALLNQVMQGTFSKLDLLERANPSFLINAANLMGDYFAEARLCNGNKVHILASPLLQYMRALLNSDDIRAHRSLATQLMQNGRELLSVLAQELDDLSISIRLRLLTPPPVSIIWLLLSADLCLNKFLPLPNTLQQFYASHLELTSDENYSEVSYGSWKKSPEKDEFKSDSSDFGDKVSQNLSNISLNHDEDHKPKLRPILGAGAAKLRQSQEQAISISQDNYEPWTKSSLAKRYDLNSWRQADDEKKQDEEYGPNFQQVTVPDYPPPNITNIRYAVNNFPQETFPNYLQQGDGTYIQNQYSNNQNFTPQGDFYPNSDKAFPQTQEKVPFSPEKTDFVPQYPTDRPVAERVNNEVQKNANRRNTGPGPIENWRKEKSDLKEDPNRNRPKNWTRQRSKDSINDEERDVDKFKNRPISARPANRLNRRNSSDNSDSGAADPNSPPPAHKTAPPPRRHVTEVPRNNKYWDHDDRCDKDYNS
ncbi:hypothetical protein NE865_12606 [Phthorimaea operculella]|nr:hypothetical protein NE865_12606 [Phthorimaea operculella]